MYEKYITSPVPWIKEIPSHWALIRGKNLYKKMQRPVRKEDGVVTCFRDGTVTLRKNRRTTGFTESLQEIGYQGIKKGDLVIHVMDAFAGSIGVSDSDGKGTPVYNVCQAIGDSNNFYFALLLREMARTGYIQSLYRGIRERSSDFRFEVFASQFYPIPPRDEQEQIVRFLDWKVSAINRLINLRRKEIKFLEDVREIIICNSVYGINTNSKPIINEIEHINIPSHWKRMRIKNLFDMRDERNHKALQDVNLLSLYAKLGVIQNKDIEYSMGNHARTAEGYKKVYKNDIVVNIILCWMGAVGISLYDGVTSPAYDVYIPRQNVCSQYYHYLFRTKIFSDECYKAGKGIMAMRWRVYSPQFRNICVPYPPIIEQIEIVNYLVRKCKIIENHIQLIHGQIENLHDLKARLISDVVTGKIDVRGVEVPEFAPVEEEAGTDIVEEEVSE